MNNNNKLITKIAAITIGIILSILIIFLGFKIFQRLFTRAEDIAPRDVVVSDIGQNSVKINWSTDQETQSVVEYGTSPTALNFFAPEASKTTSHTVDLTLLSPQSTYYFQIRTGDKKYDNGGVPWTLTTTGANKTLPSVPTETVVPTAGVATPTPISKVYIPDQSATGSGVASTCNETDCAKIKSKLGIGCSTQDYFQCLKKLTPTVTGTL